MSTEEQIHNLNKIHEGLFPILDIPEIKQELTNNKHYNFKDFNRINKALKHNGIPDIKFMIKYSSLSGNLEKYYRDRIKLTKINYLTIALETCNKQWIKYLLKKIKICKLFKIFENYLLNSNIDALKSLIQYHNFSVKDEIFYQLSDIMQTFVIKNNLYKIKNNNRELLRVYSISYKIIPELNDIELGLQYACTHGNLFLAKLMILEGAKTTYAGLCIAAISGKIDLVELMLTYESTNLNDVVNYTIVFGKKEHMLKILELLIKYGANNYNDILYDACYYGYLEIASMVLNYNVTNINGGLYYACIKNHIKLVELMIKNGAIPNKVLLNRGLSREIMYVLTNYSSKN